MNVIQKRYFLLLRPINGSRRFAATDKHPHDGINEVGTPAGAYQITLDTYRGLSLPIHGIGREFDPLRQDRFAVAYLEQISLCPLALIRSGNISDAVNSLLKIWSSLPGTKQSRSENRGKTRYVYTLEDFLRRHEEFSKEMINE